LSRLQSFALDLATERRHLQPGAQPRGALLANPASDCGWHLNSYPEVFVS
jgi:hypothetical protein